MTDEQLDLTKIPKTEQVSEANTDIPFRNVKKSRKSNKVTTNNNNKDNNEPKIEDLLLTKKEKKLIRKRERREREKRVQNQNNDDFDNDSEDDDISEVERIKRKLDTIPNVYARDDDTVLQEQEQETQQPQQRQIQDNQQIQTYSNQTNQVPDLVKPKQSHEAGRVIQNQVATPPMDESGDVDLNKLFSSEVGNESDVVKELFTQENIKVKTELTKDEISIISRLELQASMTQNFFLTKVLKELEVLRVSKDRKSRSEFVQSFSGIKDTQSGATAFGKLGGIFKNDKV